jgi:RNA polymerase sigma-70 factor (ECF subfamily)
LSRVEPAWDWQAAYERCLREARRFVRDPVAADEVTQEAFLRAWRGRRGCAAPHQPLPWLLAITRNEALRFKARPHLAHELASLEAAETSVARAPRQDSIVARLDLRRAMGRLSEPDRLLLRLRYEEDLTQPQIAARLGIPEGTVKIRLHRLRARLRAELE